MKVVYCGPPVYKDFYDIQWSLTNNCNYNCSFCGISQNEKFNSLDDMKKNLELINYLNSKKEIKLRLFGGEPTIHPEFLNLLKIIEVDNVAVFTNLHKSKDFLKEMININPNISIKTSFQQEFEKLPVFLDKAKFIADYGNDIQIFLTLSNKNKQTVGLYNDIKNSISKYNNIRININIIHELINQESAEWADSLNVEKSKIKFDNGKEIIVSSNVIINNNYNNYRLFKCYCGINNIFIDNNDVHYCQTYRNHNIKPIFNTLNHNYKNYKHIFNNPILCNIKKCFCEFLIVKEKVFKKL